MAINDRWCGGHEHRAVIAAARTRDTKSAGDAMRERITTAGRALRGYVASKNGRIGSVVSAARLFIRFRWSYATTF